MRVRSDFRGFKLATALTSINRGFLSDIESLYNDTLSEIQNHDTESLEDAFQFSVTNIHKGYSFIQELFKNEFAYDIEKTPEYYVQKSIKSFVSEAVITPHQTLPDTYNITSEGLRKLKLFSGFLKTYFET